MFWLIILCAFGGLAYYMYSQNKQEEIEEAQEGSETSLEGEKQGELRRMKLDKKWKTISTSGTLVAGADGKRDALEALIKRNLKVLAVPNIRVEERLVSYAGIYDMLGGGRKQLVIRNTKIKGYVLFVNAYDYGKQLHVSWYLMLRVNWLSRLLAMAEKNPALYLPLLPVVILAKFLYHRARTTIPEMMNMFETEELSAYLTTIQHAVSDAVSDVAKDLNLNSAKIGWQTRGFHSIV